MADKKISQLPASTVPLAGTEELALVQSGDTKKSSVTNLTSGRAIPASGYQLESGGIITETSTSRTLSTTDNGKVIYCTSDSAVTIAGAASLGAGFSCVIIQAGDGQVTVTDGGGAVTLLSYVSLVKTAGKYATISVFSPVADTLLLAGNLGI
jgi:hypothetical protein